MDKHVREAVANRADGYCENCGKWAGDSLQLHHILRRLVKETPDNCCMLCLDCHEELHHGKNGHVIDIKLKLMVQEVYFKRGLSEEETRRLMGGRLY